MSLMLPLFRGHVLFLLNPGAGGGKRICILSMQCLQISNPCIIIYTMKGGGGGGAVEQLILLAACEN